MVPAVESPFTFFQEPIETAFRNAIKAPPMALRLIPKVLDTIDVMTSFTDEHRAVIHTPMMKFGHIQHVIDQTYPLLGSLSYSSPLGFPIKNGP
jgi:hypothetical protein